MVRFYRIISRVVIDFYLHQYMPTGKNNDDYGSNVHEESIGFCFNVDCWTRLAYRVITNCLGWIFSRFNRVTSKEKQEQNIYEQLEVVNKATILTPFVMQEKRDQGMTGQWFTLSLDLKKDKTRLHVDTIILQTNVGKVKSSVLNKQKWF